MLYYLGQLLYDTLKPRSAFLKTVRWASLWLGLLSSPFTILSAHSSFGACLNTHASSRASVWRGVTSREVQGARYVEEDRWRTTHSLSPTFHVPQKKSYRGYFFLSPASASPFCATRTLTPKLLRWRPDSAPSFPLSLSWLRTLPWLRQECQETASFVHMYMYIRAQAHGYLCILAVKECIVFGLSMSFLRGPSLLRLRIALYFYVPYRVFFLIGVFEPHTSFFPRPLPLFRSVRVFVYITFCFSSCLLVLDACSERMWC